MASLTGKQKIVNALSSQLRLINGNSSGTAATATCTVSSGSIDAITLTSSGRGYETVPEVTVSQPTTASATGEAVLSSNTVSSITILNGGGGYTTTPAVTISAPDRATSAEIKFGDNSLYHSSYSNTSLVETFASSVVTDATNGYSLRFWVWPDSMPGGQNISLLFTDKVKISYNATSGVVDFQFDTNGGVTSGTEALTAQTWNYVQVDHLNNSVRLSVNGVSAGSFIGGGGTVFATGTQLYAGVATAAQSVADNANRSFIGYIDDVSIDAFTTSMPAATTPTTARAGSILTQTFDNDQATATATLTNGVVTSITVTDSGGGYITQPTVTIDAAPTSRVASLRAIKNSGEDFITEIQIVDGGTGYISVPTISIGTPPTFNSLLYQNVFKDFRYIQEVNDFPTIVMTTGRIDRDHQMGGVIYDQFLVNLRGYVMSENPIETCEDLAEDMERVINRLRDVKSDKGVRGIVESRVLEIRTDEGLFEPYGILDITAQIIYDYEALIDSGFLMLESGDGFLLTEGGDPIILEGAAGQNILVIEDGVGQLLDSSGRRI